MGGARSPRPARQGHCSPLSSTLQHQPPRGGPCAPTRTLRSAGNRPLPGRRFAPPTRPGWRRAQRTSSWSALSRPPVAVRPPAKACGRRRRAVPARPRLPSPWGASPTAGHVRARHRRCSRRHVDRVVVVVETRADHADPTVAPRPSSRAPLRRFFVRMATRDEPDPSPSLRRRCMIAMSPLWPYFSSWS